MVKAMNFRKRSGQAILIFTIGLLMFIAFCGMVIDFGRQYMFRQKLRNYCDSSSMAGANLLPDTGNCAPVLEAMRVYSRNILIAGEAPPTFTCPAPTTQVVNGVTMKTYQFTYGQDTVDITTPYTDSKIQSKGIDPNTVIRVQSCRVIRNHFGRLLGFPQKTMCMFAAAQKGGGPNIATTAPLAVPTSQSVNGSAEWTEIVYDTGDPATSSINDVDFVVGHIYKIKGGNFSPSGFKGIVDLNNLIDQNGNPVPAPNPQGDFLSYISNGFPNIIQVGWRAGIITGQHQGPVEDAVTSHNTQFGTKFGVLTFDDRQGSGSNTTFRITGEVLFEWTSTTPNPFEFAKFLGPMQSGQFAGGIQLGGSALIE